MNFPAELKYTQEHEWIKVESDVAIIGITDFAQKELGDIVFVDIPSIGTSIEANQVFGSIEAVKTVSDLFMPATGEIVELNPKLESNPELVNSDPYGDGWIIKVKLNDVGSIDALLTAEKYKSLVGV